MKNKTAFVNANIITMDNNHQFAKSILVNNGIILDVSNEAFPEKYNTTDIDIYDLNGKTIMPGFIDTHIHLFDGGKFRKNLNLENCHNISEISDSIKIYSKKMNAGKEWIVGYGFTDKMFGGIQNINRTTLDKIEGEKPVLLIKNGGHSCLVNSKALEKYPIEKLKSYIRGDSIDIDSLIIKDDKGKLSGVFLEILYKVFLDIVEKNEKPDYEAIAVDTIQYLLSHGVTTVHDNTFYRKNYNVYKKLKDENNLNIRVNCWLYGYKKSRNQLEHLIKYNDDRLKITGAKYFLDGSINSRTAYLREPYSDIESANYDNSNRGLLLLDKNKLMELIKHDKEMGLQTIIHCIGDGAIEFYLDILNEHFNKTDISENQEHYRTKPRIEHCTILSDDLLKKLIRLKPIVTYQQGELTQKVLCMYEKRIGKKRMNHLDEVRFMIDNNIPVSFSSDWPYINPPEPLNMLEQYKTQNNSVTIKEMLEIYTKGNAYAGISEAFLGVIGKNYFADFIVLSDNPLKEEYIKEKALSDIKVEQVYSNGKLVYQIADTPQQ